MIHCNNYLGCGYCREIRCPEYDERRIGTCSICGNSIYESEHYISVNGELIHIDCVNKNLNKILDILDINIFDVIKKFAEVEECDA